MPPGKKEKPLFISGSNSRQFQGQSRYRSAFHLGLYYLTELMQRPSLRPQLLLKPQCSTIRLQHRHPSEPLRSFVRAHSSSGIDGLGLGQPPGSNAEICAPSKQNNIVKASILLHSIQSHGMRQRARGGAGGGGGVREMAVEQGGKQLQTGRPLRLSLTGLGPPFYHQS